MRLIDADALYEAIKWKFFQSASAVTDIGMSILGKVYKTIIDAPTIEPVHCRDCKHAHPEGRYGCRCYHHDYSTHDMKPNDYCSRAERKDT